MTRYQSLQQHPIQNIQIWFKIFIPKNIPGITRQVKNGINQGKTYVPHPVPLSGLGYLTDQRGFSSDKAASARATIPVNINLGGLVPLATGISFSDETFEIEVGREVVSCSRLATRWVKPTVVGTAVRTGEVITVPIEAEPANPCSPVSEVIGKVDVRGVIKIDLYRMSIEFDGMIAPVPAYEMYAQADNGPVVTLFQCEPIPGSSFSSLIGSASRRLKVRADLNGTGHRVDGTLFGSQTDTLFEVSPRYLNGGEYCR